jgi:hypothetical protein
VEEKGKYTMLGNMWDKPTMASFLEEKFSETHGTDVFEKIVVP